MSNDYLSLNLESFIALFQQFCFKIKIIRSMYTKIQAPKQSQGYLARRFNVEAFEQEREEYYSLIQRLNLENKELNKNYKKLLIENIELKRIIQDQGSQKDGKITIKYSEDKRKVMKTQQVDFSDDRRQRERTPNQRLNNNRQDEIKTLNVPKQKKGNFDQSKMKKPTIIEELSESHFNRKSNSSNQISRSSKKEKELTNIQSQPKKEVTQEQQQSNPPKKESEQHLKEINFHESRETIELVPKEQESNQIEYSETREVKLAEGKPPHKHKQVMNPQKYETTRSKQDAEYKKDNAPYRTISNNGTYLSVGPPMKKTYHAYLLPPKNNSALKPSNQRYCSNC